MLKIRLFGFLNSEAKGPLAIGGLVLIVVLLILTFWRP
jgi:hypothetical protein